MSLPRLYLKPGREKSLLRRHPWIYSGAVQEVTGSPAPGDTVQVFAKDKHLANAAWSPQSQLCGRVWSFDPEEKIDESFFRNRIMKAANLRSTLGLDAPDGGCRLIYSESDQLPGIIVDRYANCAAVQFLSTGAEKYRELIGKLLLELDGIDTVFDRSDASIRKKEGLPSRCGFLCGAPLPEKLVITEDGLKYNVDLQYGQKTGFYFDLREARRTLRRFAQNRRVLNLFSYTGAFGCVALGAGAKSVINVDSSAPALKMAEKNLALNGFSSNFENRQGDGFTVLRELAAGEKFDLVILDPPKLVQSRNDLNRAAKAYKDMALVALQILNPGGMLANFSCSGLMDADLFQKITFDAALDAGRNLRMIEKLEQDIDHVWCLNVPEGFYLKGHLMMAD